MNKQNNAARVAVKAAACPDTPAKDKPQDVFDCMAMDLPRAQWAEAMAEPCPDLESEQPFNLQKAYQLNTVCGFNRELRLSAHEVQSIAARLRGISAISALFIAVNDRGALKLGEWIESGLNEALHALADDANSILEASNERAEEGGAA